METGRGAEEGHRRTVTLRLPGLDGQRSVRHPRFISISKLPYGTWAFRFELLTEGRDDLQDRDFDWWFEKLKEAVEADRANPTRNATRVRVQVITRSGDEATQIAYTGRLVRGDKRQEPRLCDFGMFEFNLHGVEVTEVWGIEDPPA